MRGRASASYHPEAVRAGRQREIALPAGRIAISRAGNWHRPSQFPKRKGAAGAKSPALRGEMWGFPIRRRLAAVPAESTDGRAAGAGWFALLRAPPEALPPKFWGGVAGWGGGEQPLALNRGQMGLAYIHRLSVYYFQECGYAAPKRPTLYVAR